VHALLDSRHTDGAVTLEQPVAGHDSQQSVFSQGRLRHTPDTPPEDLLEVIPLQHSQPVSLPEVHQLRAPSPLSDSATARSTKSLHASHVVVRSFDSNIALLESSRTASSQTNASPSIQHPEPVHTQSVYKGRGLSEHDAWGQSDPAAGLESVEGDASRAGRAGPRVSSRCAGSTRQPSLLPCNTENDAPGERRRPTAARRTMRSVPQGRAAAPPAGSSGEQHQGSGPLLGAGSEPQQPSALLAAAGGEQQQLSASPPVAGIDAQLRFGGPLATAAKCTQMPPKCNEVALHLHVCSAQPTLSRQTAQPTLLSAAVSRHWGALAAPFAGQSTVVQPSASSSAVVAERHRLAALARIKAERHHSAGDLPLALVSAAVATRSAARSPPN
jgi:hypothetical protein